MSFRACFVFIAWLAFEAEALGKPAAPLLPRKTEELDGSAEIVNEGSPVEGADSSHVFDQQEQLFIAPPMQASCPSLPATLTAGILTAALCGLWGGGWAMLRYTDIGKAPASDDNTSGGGGGARLDILDNAKFFIMILVIFQHTGAAYITDDFRTDVFQFIQMHTRLFCFLSGLVSKKPPDMRSIKSLVFALVVPHILWVTVIQSLIFLQRGDMLRGATVQEYTYARMTEIFTGAGLEWFLFSLIWWRILGWALMAFQPAPRMFVAISISLLGGYPEKTIVTSIAHHILAYLPVFVLGQLFPLAEILERVPTGYPSMAAGITLLLGFFALEGPVGRDFMAQIPMYDWMDMPTCGAVSDALFWVRGCFRTMLELSKSMVFLFLVCPRSKCFITPYGQASLYPYLLQGLMSREYALCWQVFSYFGQPPQLVGLAGAMANCTLVNILLATWPVKAVFGVFLEPTWCDKLAGTQLESSKEPLAKKGDASIGNTFAKDTAKSAA